MGIFFSGTNRPFSTYLCSAIICAKCPEINGTPCSVFSKLLLAKDSNFINQQDSNSFLRQKRSFGDLFKTVATTAGPTTIPKSKEEIIRSQQEYFVELYSLTSVEAWEEFKDKLEYTDTKEEQVDELERCVDSCWRTDQLNDFLGKSHEEMKEKAEKAYENSCAEDDDIRLSCDHSKLKTKSIACPKCIRYIPFETKSGASLTDMIHLGKDVNSARKKYNSMK